MSAQLQIDTQSFVPVLSDRELHYSTRPPSETFRSAKIMARAWAESLDERRRLSQVRGFMTEAIEAYAEKLGRTQAMDCKPSTPQVDLPSFSLDFTAANLAAMTGQAAAEIDPVAASYWLSVTYTAMLPDALRSRLGIYYTPPALSARLLDMASEAGIDWRTCTVLDPACGGGAFLGPAALRMADARLGHEPARIVESITERLRGFEIDPFAAWLSQTFLEISLADLCTAANMRLPQMVNVCDSLKQEPGGETFDLVIGNPPYGRVRLSPELRKRYQRSLYGHANLYGIFTDLALRWSAPGGVIAYVTPTSFLAGEYFKALRALLATEAPPEMVDFIEARKGVFEGVLQETMLATYHRSGRVRQATVHYVAVSADGAAHVSPAGNFQLPVEKPSAPWLMPRRPEQAPLIARLAGMPSRLSDWGYKVSTGPLVWNRHKEKLRRRAEKGSVPLIWAEAIAGPGRFVFRAKKKQHEPYFKLRQGDEWLLIDKPCVLLQRTTAKEQSRRLLAAALPEELISEHGGVVIENHLNMIRPRNGPPQVSPCSVAAVLNSEIVDLVFRCISGSVAVSAFELEALPLPSLKQMRIIEGLITRRAGPETIERCLRSIYLGESA